MNIFPHPGKTKQNKEQTCGQHIVSYKRHLETCVINVKFTQDSLITSKVYIFVV